MKFRVATMVVAATALVAVGCGSDSDSKKDSDAKKDGEKKEMSVEEAKAAAVSDAKKAFDDNPKDAQLCRDYGMKLVALASPESTGDPKKNPEPPKDREKNLEKALSTYEECSNLAPRDRNIQSSLASVYMATGAFDKAAPILESIANSAKGAERPNAFYAWGLAASNAQDTASAIKAWTVFADTAPDADPRVKQVRESIKSLREIQKNPPKAAPAAADADEGDDS